MYLRLSLCPTRTTTFRRASLTVSASSYDTGGCLWSSGEQVGHPQTHEQPQRPALCPPPVRVKATQSCPTLCDPMDYLVHGILQARILEWVAFPFSRGIFPTQGLNPGLLPCRWILYQLSHQGRPATPRVAVKALPLAHEVFALWPCPSPSLTISMAPPPQGPSGFLWHSCLCLSLHHMLPTPPGLENHPMVPSPAQKTFLLNFPETINPSCL